MDVIIEREKSLSKGSTQEFYLENGYFAKRIMGGEVAISKLQ